MSQFNTKIALFALLLVPGCTAGGGSQNPVPVDPSTVVAEFLGFARAGSLGEMGSLWGDRRGPASTYMTQSDLRKRLTVIAAYLQHDSYEFTQPEALTIAQGDGRKGVAVILMRSGCRAMVPFTLIPWSGRWLIEDIDLAGIGNPARSCAGPEPGS